MKYLWIVLQVSLIPFAYVLVKILRVQIIHENTAPLQKGCLIISSHECKLDPLFVLYGYGLKSILQILPFQFPVTAEYMNKKVLGKIISLFGGFSVGESIEEKAKSLFFIREILKKQGGILIFPEARLVQGTHRFEDFQKGYTYLMQDNIQVILVKLENFYSLERRLFAKERPRVTFLTMSKHATQEEIRKGIETFYASN